MALGGDDFADGFKGDDNTINGRRDVDRRLFRVYEHLQGIGIACGIQRYSYTLDTLERLDPVQEMPLGGAGGFDRLQGHEGLRQISISRLRLLNDVKGICKGYSVEAEASCFRTGEEEAAGPSIMGEDDGTTVAVVGKTVAVKGFDLNDVGETGG